MAKLTKTFIDSVPIPAPRPNGNASQKIYRDESLPGFGLLVGSGGTKSFFVEKRVSGKVKRITIGRYGHLTPVQAKNKAHELLGEIALGKDPAEKRKAATANNLTLGAAIEDYFQSRKNLKPATIKTYRTLFNGCIGDWLSKKVVDISKDMIETRHAEIGTKAPVRANNVMRTLRAVFNHVIAKHDASIIAANPVDRISNSRAWYKVRRRRTHLSQSELRDWYKATLQLPQDVSRDYMHFLLFTGLRRTEAATLTWEQINFRDKTFTIQDTKNGEPHTLPLSSALLEILSRRKEVATNKWVFPSPIGNDYLKDPRGSIEFVYKEMGKSVTFHDLRRTFITIAESLDIPAYALKQLLNHSNPNDVTQGYIVINVERLRDPMQKITNQILIFAGG